MEPVALTLFVALALLCLFRTPGVFCPVEAAAGNGRLAGATIPGEEDEEELPQTDQAPSSRPWLPWAVGAVAAARFAALLALHA
jgi:hypothetical protein